jgi:DNA polymerase-3 subunit beta
MRFLVNREKLCEAVTNLSRAVATKATFPVLEGIHMTATNDGLKMMAYNLEIGMTKTIDITCAEEGSVVFKAKLLGEILRSMTGDNVSFEVDDRLVCKIKCGSAVFDIMGMPPSDFPEMPTVENLEKIVFPSENLKDMVRQTIFATAPADAQKPVLTGLLFDIKNTNVSVVGVDGYRLAVRKENLNIGAEMSFVISAKTIGEAVKIITEEDENVEFYVGKRHVSMCVDGYTIVSRKIEGEFIDYKKIMPSSFATTIKISTKEVISIIERISLIINDQLKTPMRCKIGEGEILFSCATALGRATDSYSVETNGETFEIGINSRFLLDALKATESEEVTINFNGPFASVIINPTSGDDFLYMVMPMRLKAE